MKEKIILSFEYEIEYTTPRGRRIAVKRARQGAIDSTAWLEDEVVCVKMIGSVDNAEEADQ